MKGEGPVLALCARFSPEGFAISIVSSVVRLHGEFKYDPAISEAEFHQMGNMTVNEMEAALAKRRVKLKRWDSLRETVPYPDFWKRVAHDAVVPSCGVFLACAWVGGTEKRRVPKGI